MTLTHLYKHFLVLECNVPKASCMDLAILSVTHESEYVRNNLKDAIWYLERLEEDIACPLFNQHEIMTRLQNCFLQEEHVIEDYCLSPKAIKYLESIGVDV